MASALEMIIEWANNELPAWLSDAARRALLQDAVTEQDEDELLAMLKASHGLADPQNPAPQAVPISKGQVSGAPAVRQEVVLKSVTALKNVNAIPDGSILKFGHQGLTVVYGENGSGKSGYARVLKRACSARDTKESLLPNAFGDDAGPASAQISVTIKDGLDQTVLWMDGQESSPLLSNICVFDSRCARVIVDENNEAHITCRMEPRSLEYWRRF